MLFRLSFFDKRFEPFNATVWRAVACRRLGSGNTLILMPEGNQNAANLDTRGISCHTSKVDTTNIKTERAFALSVLIISGENRTIKCN